MYVRHIKDLNEITSHMMEVVHSQLGLLGKVIGLMGGTGEMLIMIILLKKKTLFFVCLFSFHVSNYRAFFYYFFFILGQIDQSTSYLPTDHDNWYFYYKGDHTIFFFSIKSTILYCISITLYHIQCYIFFKFLLELPVYNTASYWMWLALHTQTEMGSMIVVWCLRLLTDRCYTMKRLSC